MGGTQDLWHSQPHHLPLSCPPCPLCSHPAVLVWQLCIQMRCPSYLHWHRITLLEKSDSATSCLGFTTTWGGQGAGLGTLLPCLGQAGMWQALGGTEQHPDLQAPCPWRAALSPELQRLGGPSAPLSPNLEGVAAWWHVSDVDPLAVDVMAVGVPAAHAHPLFPKVGTGEASLQPCRREGR